MSRPVPSGGGGSPPFLGDGAGNGGVERCPPPVGGQSGTACTGGAAGEIMPNRGAPPASGLRHPPQRAPSPRLRGRRLHPGRVRGAVPDWSAHPWVPYSCPGGRGARIDRKSVV